MAKNQQQENMPELGPDDGIVTVEATRDYAERGMVLRRGMRANIPVERLKTIMAEHDYEVPEFDSETGQAVTDKSGKPKMRKAPLPVKVIEASEAEAKEIRGYSNRSVKSKEMRAAKEAEALDVLGKFGKPRR